MNDYDDFSSYDRMFDPQEELGYEHIYEEYSELESLCENCGEDYVGYHVCSL